MNVIITGASRGIGKAIASIFAANGHHLILSSQNENVLHTTVKALQDQYPQIEIHAKAFDLSKDAAVFGKWVLHLKKNVDILVNNAGIFEPGNVYDEPEGLLEKQIATNVYSAYHLTRSLLPAMMAAKQGHIFNICSIASLKAYKNGGAYSISKFALAGFSKNLREEMMSHGIKVTTVYPGAVLTDAWGDFDNSSGRIMEVEDIAKMVFAASQLSQAACVEEIIIRPRAGDL
jgi:short-subunit dehydrogenase